MRTRSAKLSKKSLRPSLATTARLCTPCSISFASMIQSRQALVESATELDAASRSRIEKNLNEQYGGGLSFTYNTDAELLGGVKIRVGNDVWDGSVQSRLDRLANAF